MPAQQGVGGDDQVELAELDAGEAVQQRGEYGPERPGQLGHVHLALQYGELVAWRRARISRSFARSLIGNSRMKLKAVDRAR
ncbi:hypothetical protein GCM10022206_58790 [Streptomyces chiangmaiensis]